MKPIAGILASILIMLPTWGLADSRIERSTDGSVRLMVDDAPFIIIGGETGNSMASCPTDVEMAMRMAVGHGYNTVLIPMSWELIEPVKGEYDFSSVDNILMAARRHELRVVPLWFGAWKNSMSCYAPAWFKRNIDTYPRAVTSAGKPLEIASAFSEAVYEADAEALRHLLRHIADTDSAGSVIMLQIENEIGMLEDARDHSPQAEAEYAKGVPADLMHYLKKHVRSLHHSLLAKWRNAGMKSSGTWTEVFGDDVYTDEIFQALAYARYVERLAREARKIFPSMPLYVNAAMNSRGRRPGEYPSAGPLAHLKDVWHAAAPTIDILAPDLYDKGFTDWLAAYALPDNPLFVPEIRAFAGNSAQAYYAIGEHKAIGLSPFAYNLQPKAEYAYQREGNLRLRSLTPLICAPSSITYGLYFDADSISRDIVDNGLRIRSSHYFTLPWDPRATDGSKWPATGGIIIRIAPMDYIVAGSGIVLTFEPEAMDTEDEARLGEDGFLLSGSERANVTPLQWHGKRIGLASVREVDVSADGTLTTIRTFNGDETHQGRHVRIGADGFKVLHVRLYEY